MRALLSVYDKTGIVEFARGLHELGVGAGVDRRHREGDRRRRHPRDRRRRHHRRSRDPRPPCGHAAPEGARRHPRRPRRTRRTTPTWTSYGIEPFDLVVVEPLPVRARSPDIETIDIGGPAMMRAAAKNHAWVAIVTDPTQYDDVLAELRRRRRRVERRHATRARARGVRAHRRVRRRDRGVAPDATTSCPQHLGARARAHRRAAALRREPAPARRALPHRRHHELVGRRRAARRRSRSATSTSTTPTPRGASRTTSATGRRRSRSSSTPTRAASRWPTTSPTAYQRALECDERSAFGGIVALNRPVDAATVERMVAGPQADVVIAPGYERGHDRGAAQEAQEHPPARGAAARAAGASTSARSAAASWCRTPHHFVAGARRLARRHQARAHRRRVARRRAGVAHLSAT